MSRQLKLLQAGESVVRRVPRSVLKAVSTTIGVASRAYARGGRRQAAIHQQRVTPGLHGWKLERRVDGVYSGYATYWLESLRLPYLSRQQVNDAIAVHGYEHVEAGLAAGNGVILALPHLGGWEWAGRWLADQGVDVVAVAERLGDEEVHRYLTDLRAALGVTVIELDARQGPKCWRPCAPMRWCASSQIAICRAGE